MRTKVKISEIIELKNRLQEINSLELSDIDFIDDNNEKVIIKPKIIDDFKYCGLGNCDFITTNFYLYGFEN